MPKISYINGAFMPHAFAQVSVDDRGIQFGDGVYEVISVQHGTFIDAEPHLDRLRASLHKVKIDFSMSRAALSILLREVRNRNALEFGMLLIKVTRGSAPRNHIFPHKTKPTLFISAKHVKNSPLTGSRVISLPENRWRHPDIKSLNLLPNVLAKQSAFEAGAYEAWFVREDGMVTEGSLSNAWIVDAAGILITTPAEGSILAGITRERLLKLARAAKLQVQERWFSLDEAKQAQEAFVSGSTTHVKPITQIDDTIINSGAIGPITHKLAKLYKEYCQPDSQSGSYDASI